MNQQETFRTIDRVVAITSTAALLGVPQIANADVVTDWNTIAVSTVSADRVNNRQTRDMVMVHAAMFDAMNAIRPYYTPAMVSITTKGYASREAAAAQAAHDVLLALFPDQQANLDAYLAASLAQIPNDDEHGRQPKYWGIMLAALVVVLRSLALICDEHRAVAGDWSKAPRCGAKTRWPWFIRRRTRFVADSC